MINLTKNQKIVYQTILKLILKNQIQPTLEILKEQLYTKIKVSSLNSIVQYLKSLENKGLIFREKNKKGGIYLTQTEQGVELKNKTSTKFFEIPLLGLANCGSPTIFADQQFETMIKISQKLLPTKNERGVFMVKVSGDSMNKRGLNNGDYAIIKHKDHCGPIENGDVVLAVINGLATIKTLIKSVDTIILRPESTKKKYQPIFLHKEDNFFINGKLVGVFKNA